MSERGLSVLFVLRCDAGVKGGGDLVQARAYQRVLESVLDCKVFYSHEISREELGRVEWGLVHVFNVSRLHENMASLEGVRFKKLVLSPILQPGFGFGLKLFFKNFLRSFFWRHLSLKVFLVNPRELIVRFDGFVFLSESEREAFWECFPEASGRINVIYENGVVGGLLSGGEVRTFDFAIVGRVEPKKRVVEAIDAVADVAPKALLLCVGGVNWYHPLYFIRFFLRVLQGKVVYVGSRDSLLVYEFMRNTRTLLNFSELEVSPLVDLEALACGCNVVSTRYSYAHLSQSNYFERIDVKDYSACVRAIRKSLGVNERAKVKVNTWGDNSHSYLDMVRRLTGNGIGGGVIACAVP